MAGRCASAWAKGLTALFPSATGFTVQVNLSAMAIDRALQAGLGASAQQAIERAKLCSEGKWPFVPITDAGDLADVWRLIALRVTEKRIRTRPG